MKEHFERVKAATVAVAFPVESEGAKPFSIVGSGFCVDPAGIVVTASHVVSGFLDRTVKECLDEVGDKEKSSQRIRAIYAREMHVIFFRGLPPTHLLAAPAPVDLVMGRSKFDVALLRASPHATFPHGYPTVEIEQYEKVAEGDEVATCGFPLGDFLQEQLGAVTSSFTKGIVSSIIPAQAVSVELLKGFLLNLTAAHGSSGGPVFSVRTGKVFGVLTEGVPNGEGGLLHGLAKADPVYPVILNGSVGKMKETRYGEPPSHLGLDGAHQ